MPKVKLIQTNWTAGEVSPLMQGRVDVNKYANGAAQLSNMLVRQQGPLWRRSGTKFVSEVKDSTKKVIFQEFTFNDAQEYVLEIGNLYIRIWLNGGFVETAPGSGIPLEIVTPYLEADLANLRFTQSADVLYIASPSYRPKTLSRLSANSWALADYALIDGPYLSSMPAALANATITVDSVSASADLAFSSAVFGTSSPPIAITDVFVDIGTDKIRIKAVGNTYVVGDIVTVTDIKYSYNGGPSHDAAFPTGNGQYTIEANLGGGYVVLHESQGLLTWSGYAYDYSTASVSKIGNSPYVEFFLEGTWRIATVYKVINSKHATIAPNQIIKDDLPRSTNIAFTPDSGSTSVGVITADHSGVFSQDDVGKYVRDPRSSAGSGQWYLLTYLRSDSSMSCQKLSVTGYNYPSVFPAVTNYKSFCRAWSPDTAAVFVNSDIGRHIRFNFRGKQPWGIIIAVLNGWTATVQLMPASGSLIPSQVPIRFENPYSGPGGNTATWRLGAFSDTTGWPEVAGFHEQRQCFAATNTEPQNLWMSQSGDYPNFAPTLYDSVVTDACAITYMMTSSRANPIYWMVSGPTLLVGTLGSEFQVKASTLGQPITPTNIMVLPQTNHGSIFSVIPQRVGYAVLFIQRAGRKLMELTYEFTLDSYVGRDLTILSEHILRKGGQALRMRYQQQPNSTLWLCLTDGTLAAMTYEREQQVTAWHSHVLGGTSPVVESIAVVSSAAGTEDLLYMVVRRTVNGATKRYIEVIQPDFLPTGPTDKANMWFLDCALQYIGAPIVTVTGLAHLNGEHITVVADGAVLPGTFLVAGGQITLPRAASNVIAGYGYRSLLQVLPLEGGSPNGTTQGKTKKASRLALRFLTSVGFKFGETLDKLDEESFRQTSDPMDSSPPLFTGDKIVDLAQDFGFTGQYYVVMDEPYPLTLLMLAPDVEVGQ